MVSGSRRSDDDRSSNACSGRQKPPELITIVAIDDEMVRDEGSYPLSRATLARIVDAITRFKPKAIAIDLLLVDSGAKDVDEALALSLRGSRKRNRCRGGLSGRQTNGSRGRWAPRPSAECRPVPVAPESVLGCHRCRRRERGYRLDGNASVRPVAVSDRGSDGSVFLLAGCRHGVGQDPGIAPDYISLGGQRIRTDIGHILPLTFYGPRGTIRTISAATVLEGQLDGGIVRDRIVVIGVTATGAGDVFPTPFDPVLPGVEVMSTAIAHLVTGDGMVRDRYVRLAMPALRWRCQWFLSVCWHGGATPSASQRSSAWFWSGSWSM